MNPANISEDDILYDLFLDQLSKMSAENYAQKDDDYFETDELQVFSSRTKYIPESAGSQVVEMPVTLQPSVPIEAVYKKRLIFGNYVSVNRNSNGEINGIILRRVNGEVVCIDISQIISVWDSLSEDEPISSPAAWAAVANDALDILKNMSPRKSDLQEVWKLISRRSLTLPVNN